MTSNMSSERKEEVIILLTKVQKWGNSLAVRIPSNIAEKIEIEQGSEIELSLVNQVLTLKPKIRKATLDELLAKVTNENRHSEIDFGSTEGNELL
ncbi:AbrB/MazE/SpoVT family DNA-binding domain-containing protein [Ferdinandcohnia quinoae]|uniref:AbrB/MazE/SpoVT family DNA-binding domain-containing protein n=1 Tax=Fredinandcohnia quinoae TaxID=2918902 RepID=A0AAW5E0K3_9BACI|nr:AbrB/MazE/SpoVT family DNA-binding domain-containing protein [Fredinandcohnia sp. SECRCQ15]MCH1626445.1 AbrB/MazE/SpoVT family DNA-binding domain-containing protein [Fredinandcohnia sp. SECRCQ15]